MAARAHVTQATPQGALASTLASRSRRTSRQTPFRALLVLVILVLAAVAPTAQASETGGHGQGVAVTEITCNHVVFSYSGFPEAEGNTVHQTVKVDGVVQPATTFQFNGPTGSDTVSISSPTGAYIIDAGGSWNTNGAAGTFDHHRKLVCKPSLSVEKLQEVSGVAPGFTAAPLEGEIGDTVVYEIIVTNTGNLALTLSSFTDAHCDAGTVTGGPGESPLPPEASTTYFCEHILNAAGPYANQATVTGTPTEGAPVVETSNKVVVTVPPKPDFSIEKLQEIAGSATGFTILPLIGEVGQTVDYEMLVTNTGNVPLTFTSFSDPRCDAGTLAGGLGATPLPTGESTTYTCDHLLNAHDRKASYYSNTAKATAAPPAGLGSPVTRTSNTVLINFPGQGSGNGTTEIGCTRVTFTYTGFPNLEDNTVRQLVKANGALISETTFSFNGPSGSDTVEISPPEGEYIIDASAKWKTNGVSGGFDHHIKAVCQSTEIQ
jgi:uncharacterized repeat protein (TIGR01451 family)